MTIEEAVSLINKVDLSGKPTNWADLGCGSGLFTRALGRLLHTGSVIYGIDTTTSLLPQLSSEGVEIIPMHADFVADDLSLSGLDGLLMANSLHYVKDKAVLIDRIRRWLRPEGQILIVEYDTDRPVARWVPYPVSFSSLTGLFREAGFKEVTKLAEHPSVYNSGIMYAASIR